MESSYRCSDAGLAAWLAADPELPPEEHHILGILQQENGSIQRLRRHADRIRLAELAARGLVVPA